MLHIYDWILKRIITNHWKQYLQLFRCIIIIIIIIIICRVRKRVFIKSFWRSFLVFNFDTKKVWLLKINNVNWKTKVFIPTAVRWCHTRVMYVHSHFWIFNELISKAFCQKQRTLPVNWTFACMCIMFCVS